MNIPIVRDADLAAGKVVRYHLDQDAEGNFIDVEGRSDMTEVVQRYSRMKFGDVDAIAWWGREIAAAFFAHMEADGKLHRVFTGAKDKGAHIYLTAPGVRNVISASNRLVWEVGQRINVWLSQQGLPTVICRQVARLGSGRANYAELSREARQGRNKSTQSLIPKSDYAEFPIHVLFLDDVEVTGSTVERARRKSLAAGALSFHALFGMQVEPELAERRPGIEHELNQAEIRGGLDDVLLGVLSHRDFHPVQRMLRLLFHPRNRNGLRDFVKKIDDRVLLRIYAGAMANDYLWIQPNAESGLPLYRESLLILQGVLSESGLLDKNGLLK